MEQMSFLSTSEIEAYNLILPKLSQIILNNWLDPSKLKLNKNKDYYSITFGPYVVAQIHGDSKPWISVPRAVQYDLSQKTPLNDLREISSYSEPLCHALQEIIDAIPTEFSCCSRYEECSDHIACTNPNKEFAAGCSYRKTLSKGKVFFGKNRNID